MEIILNKCYGGLGFSKKCYELYAEKKRIRIFAYDSTAPYGRLKRAKDWEAFAEFYFDRDYGEEAEVDEIDWEDYVQLDRTDKTVIECVKELAEEANGRYAKLKVVNIPDGMKYVIDDYDGVEVLREDGPTW